MNKTLQKASRTPSPQRHTTGPQTLTSKQTRTVVPFPCSAEDDCQITVTVVNELGDKHVHNTRSLCNDSPKLHSDDNKKTMDQHMSLLVLTNPKYVCVSTINDTRSETGRNEQTDRSQDVLETRGAGSVACRAVGDHNTTMPHFLT